MDDVTPEDNQHTAVTASQHQSVEQCFMPAIPKLLTRLRVAGKFIFLHQIKLAADLR